uniref:Tyr recombinase domain-containing protein n=1 Tax=Trichogramma kaykai TaxID=54128 RepID=A0ABD2WYI8_9HYME
MKNKKRVFLKISSPECLIEIFWQILRVRALRPFRKFALHIKLNGNNYTTIDIESEYLEDEEVKEDEEGEEEDEEDEEEEEDEQPADDSNQNMQQVSQAQKGYITEEVFIMESAMKKISKIEVMIKKSGSKETERDQEESLLPEFPLKSLEDVDDFNNVLHHLQGVQYQFYHNGICTRQPIGRHKIAEVPQAIASYLKLDNPKGYTGHVFRRSTASLLSESEANMQMIKQLGRWRSDAIAQGYIETSMKNREMIYEGIIKENQSNDIEPMPSTSRKDFTRHAPIDVYSRPSTSKEVFQVQHKQPQLLETAASNSSDNRDSVNIDLHWSDFSDEFAFNEPSDSNPDAVLKNIHFHEIQPLLPPLNCWNWFQFVLPHVDEIRALYQEAYLGDKKYGCNVEHRSFPAEDLDMYCIAEYILEGGERNSKRQPPQSLSTLINDGPDFGRLLVTTRLRVYIAELLHWMAHDQNCFRSPIMRSEDFALIHQGNEDILPKGRVLLEIQFVHRVATALSPSNWMADGL